MEGRGSPPARHARGPPGRTGHIRRGSMRTRIRILAPLALVVVATAACGSSGSSGTGGGSSSAAVGSTAAAGGKACAPVAGDQLVVLKDDKALQSADNILP